MQKLIHIKDQTVIRKLCWMVCVLLMMLCSCSSSKHNYKNRRKPAPCNCPKFNYVPQPEISRDVAGNVSTNLIFHS